MNRIFKTSAALGIGLSMCFAFLSCKEQANTKEDMEHKHDHKQGDMAYACPMHPEVTGKEDDKCSKCGMPLEPQETSSTGTVKMVFSSNTKLIEAGKPVTLSFVPVSGEKDNVSLDVVHEEPIHLIVVSEDLSWFDHIHPKKKGEKGYTVDMTFPYGGNYIFFADYKPEGGEPTVDKIPVTIKGSQKQQVTWSQPKLVSEAEGYRVELVNANNIKPGEHTTLNFRISRNGKVYKAKDLGEYLGAVAHIIMIGQEDKNFVHIHPDSGEEFPISAHLTLDNPGLYRMWVQFNIDGKIITADFAVMATEGNAKGAGSHSAHQHH